MKKNWKNNALILLFLALLSLTSCMNKNEHSNSTATYTCSMHSTVVSDKPGTCPICGMDLVRKAQPGEEVKMTEDLAQLIKSPNEIVVSSIKTIKGEYKKLPVSVEAQGIVTYDTRNIFTISARFGGRLEKVFLKYPFQKVNKGQRVAEIYSPELLAAQRELLYLLESDPDNDMLIRGAKDKLSLFGATQSQINELIKRKEVQNTFTVYSPYDGYILANNQQAPVAPLVSIQSSQSGEMSDGMNKSPVSASGNTNPMASNVTSTFTPREGDYVTSGQTLFSVVDFSALRIELNISSALAASIGKGSDVALDFGDGNMQKANVDFVQPFFSQGEEFVSVRVYTKQIENLHVGHLVKAAIKGDSVEGLWIPKEAVVDLGLDKVVFLKERNVFRPKKVVLGIRHDGSVEIKQGLSSSEEIASNAQYLVDSESFVKPGD